MSINSSAFNLFDLCASTFECCPACEYTCEKGSSEDCPSVPSLSELRLVDLIKHQNGKENYGSPNQQTEKEGGIVASANEIQKSDPDKTRVMPELYLAPKG